MSARSVCQRVILVGVQAWFIKVIVLDRLKQSIKVRSCPNNAKLGQLFRGLLGIVTEFKLYFPEYVIAI